MPIGPWVVPAIGAAANVASNLFNFGAQRRENTRQRQFTMDMYNRQRQDALADWERQNAYDSPSEMMKRLKNAGLNPNLAYSNPTTAGQSSPVRSSSGSGYNAKAPQLETTGISDAIMMFYDIQKTQAMTDNLKAQADLTRLRQTMVDDQVEKLVAETANINARTVETKQKIEAGLPQKQGEKLVAETENLGLEQERRRLELRLKTLLQDNTIDQAIQKLALLTNANEATRVKIDNMIKQGKLLDFEAKLSQYGLTKGDPGWIRAFISLFEKL